MYNLTTLDNGNNILDLTSGVNTALGGWFAGFILIAVFVIMFIAMKSYDSRTVAIATSFVTSLIAVFMWALGWISMAIIFIPVALFFGALVWKGLTD
jgi:hypothetical protein